MNCFEHITETNFRNIFVTRVLVKGKIIMVKVSSCINIDNMLSLLVKSV